MHRAQQPWQPTPCWCCPSQKSVRAPECPEHLGAAVGEVRLTAPCCNHLSACPSLNRLQRQVLGKVPGSHDREGLLVIWSMTGRFHFPWDHWVSETEGSGGLHICSGMGRAHSQVPWVMGRKWPPCLLKSPGWGGPWPQATLLGKTGKSKGCLPGPLRRSRRFWDLLWITVGPRAGGCLSQESKSEPNKSPSHS